VARAWEGRPLVWEPGIAARNPDLGDCVDEGGWDVTRAGSVDVAEFRVAAGKGDFGAGAECWREIGIWRGVEVLRKVATGLNRILWGVVGGGLRISAGARDYITRWQICPPGHRNLAPFQVTVDRIFARSGLFVAGRLR
jgi:hypothetical protein